jgi:hypothetical protein
MPRKKKNASPKDKAARRRSRAATAEKPQASKKGTTVAGKNRAEGTRLFALAGRPSKEDFVKVFGPSGPRMTWEQRAAAGVPAEKFQAALASAMRQAK